MKKGALQNAPKKEGHQFTRKGWLVTLHLVKLICEEKYYRQSV